MLAIIPARAGSKGVVNKNKRLVGGQPLITYTIDAASKSKRITNILVSTDDIKIIEIASQAGIHVIKRPPELAGDHSPIVDTIKHALIEWTSNGNLYPDAVVLLQPTSPLREPSDIDKAIDIYFSHDCVPVCSVVRCEDAHPARMYILDENGKLSSLMPLLSDSRRQDLPGVFLRNGAIYVFGRVEIDSNKIITSSMVPYVMDQTRSINVDTEFDLDLIEYMISCK